MSRDIVDTSTPSDRLVVAAWVEGELSDQLACVGGEDPNVTIGDEELDRPALWARPMPMWCNLLSWRRVTVPPASILSWRTLKWAPAEAAPVGWALTRAP